MSQKRRAGENTEWRRGVGLRCPTPGAEFPLHEATFFGGAGFYPYKPHVGAFVGEDGIGHAAYRDVSDTVPRSFDYHVARGMIQVQMAFGLALRSAGRMEKPLVKVRLASGFSYVGYEGSVDRADLVDEAQTVEIAQLGEDAVGRSAVDHADEQAIGARPSIGREWQGKKRKFIVLLEDQNGPREVGLLAVDLEADIDAEMHPPYFALAKIEPFVGFVDSFLLVIPAIELLLHKQDRTILAWMPEKQRL